jgi:phosphatidylserine decarboxylase
MRAMRTKLEEIRQALGIHGGALKLCTAALAVRLSRLPIPTKRLRRRLFRTVYGKKYPALEEAELEHPLDSYRSFNALFTRGVRPELRPIAPSGEDFLSPCDGRVQEVGTVKHDRILTVKGVEYTVGSLLAGADTGPFHDGRFAILFLSPSDCHRIFSPQEGVIESVTHVPGYRLLVHPPFQKKEFPVFSLNERVVVRMSTPLGACALVLVAGWGVGHITFPFEAGFRRRRRRVTHKAYDPPQPVRRGTWIATFELGSTAILLTEPSAAWTARVRQDEKVRYGQPLFSLGSGTSGEDGAVGVGD